MKRPRKNSANDSADNPKSVEKTKQDINGSLKAIYQAIVLGLRDYVNKNRFSGIIIGLSGGIDSASIASIASKKFHTNIKTFSIIDSHKNYNEEENITLVKEPIDNNSQKYLKFLRLSFFLLKSFFTDGQVLLISAIKFFFNLISLS